MQKNAKLATGMTSECLDCARVRKSRTRVDVASVEVDSAPDHRPAVRLRQELARDRRLGVPWAEAWADDPGLAVAGLPDREARDWLAVFESQEAVWRAAWDRQVGPGMAHLVEAIDDGDAAAVRCDLVA